MIRIALPLLLACVVARAQDVLVVAPDAYRPALEKWVAYRTAQGHTVRIVAPADDLRAQVRDVHAKSGGALRFVLLLGDASEVPFGRYPTEIVKEYERDWKVPSDLLVADLDDDGAPELALGRLPADDVEEARALLAKSIAYEKSDDFGPWRRRVDAIAGVGGFGAILDAMLESGVTETFTKGLPADIDLNVTYANPSSAFCPPPTRLTETVLERLNEGSLFTVYMGHGSRMRLDRMWMDGIPHDIFTDADVDGLHARHGAPIVFLLACTTGHFDGAPDCLAEMMLKEPGGPVAVMASSRVSMPYGNAVLALEFLHTALVQRVPTLGEAFAEAKRRALGPGDGEEARSSIEALAFPYQPFPWKRRQERREQNHLYQLFGDPLLRIALPAALAVEHPDRAAPGDDLTVAFEGLIEGTATVELVGPRTPLHPPRADDTEKAFAEAYARANAGVLASARAESHIGIDTRVVVKLHVPEDAPTGVCYVRVYVEGKGAAACGGGRIEIAATPAKAE